MRVIPTRQRCPSCHGPRLIRHAEMFGLSIAHLDCDAFYASVEKRDNPDLANRPLIVGGGQRGVVATACYIARLRGVHSAMPIARARTLCPDAVVIRPNMDRYRAASRAIRALMDEVAPVVEPLSLDEAFLDLTGTDRLHGMPPAEVLVRLANRVRSEVGVTVSIGLSYNKFLAKVASDRNKPRGFFVIGRAEVREFLAAEPVSLIWGAGDALCRKLERDGIYRIGQLQAMDEDTLRNRYGSMGDRLYHFARGEDRRAVTAAAPPKSVSTEITLETDISDGHA
ncbi:MAG: DNA polymerase IV, partial [Sphingomonadales bacterium]